MASNNTNDNNSNNEEDTINDRKPSAAQQQRRQLFDSIDQEMEIAQYSTSETGQQRKRPPRKESAIRNKKRKILDKQDHYERATERDVSQERMRGSQKSLEQKVVDSSIVFYEEAKGDEQDDVMEAEGSQEEGEDDDYEVAEQDEQDEQAATDKESSAAAKPGVASRANSKASSSSSTKTNNNNKGKKRLMFRLRNFKSARMAERHGDALGAHARGQSLQAVRKLEQVAADAPTAPQVYSSLGMVYESLLSDSRNKSTTAASQPGEASLDIKDIEKQVELAKKAYGSYHVAALLCKKDFSLWVRAGDTAKEIATLCTEAMFMVSPEKREDYRREKLKWMQEAKKDYHAADNQRPPGIDVPAKLAAAQMELGNLSEALVILTDLKNRAAEPGESHSEFEKSYSAWLLYSDLMLRIGHECIQWNEGNQQNQNYMFKRWLRKWSGTFDWKERRLQALVFALEAAAGTKCCQDLIQWSKNRAAESSQDGGTSMDHRRWHVDSYETAKDPPSDAARPGEQKNGKVETVGHDPATGSDSASATTFSTPALSLERARQALFTRNELELRVFDEETQNLGLVCGSQDWNQRVQARSDLVKSHRASVVDLVGNYERHHSELETAAAAAPRELSVESISGNTSTSDSPPLPLTASCAAVCSIASELMKHCLRFELYEGCRLVGEVVSGYLKQRAELLERRLEANRTFEEKQKSTAESVLLSMEAYDEVGDDESDDDADALYLSDDEVILESADDNLVASLKNGILPPELRFLYGLGMVGESGKTFLAKQCMKAIEVLETDDIATQVQNPTDTDIVRDPLWFGFRQGFTEPLRKTAALELAVDALRKADKEAEFADFVAPLLETYLNDLQSTGQMNIALFGNGDGVSDLVLPIRDRVIKLIVASARIQIEVVKSIVETEEEEATEIAFAVLNRVVPLLQNFWKVEANGSIPSFCVSGLELLAQTFKLLIRLSATDEVNGKVLAKLLDVLSLVCGVVVADPLQSDPSNAENPFTDASFPVNADWQKPSHELLSKRMYNIAVGCIVSNFSGWEPDEFTLDNLRINSEKRHFGVRIGSERVTGYLAPAVEAELASQWEQIVELVPQFSDFDFKARLDVIKKLSWYKDRVDDVDKHGNPLSAYGEDDAFELFLMLSRLCLKAANSDSSDLAKYFALVKLALSVVLPLSEFCLDMELWDSKLGKAAITKTTKIYDWNKLAKSAAATKPSGQVITKRVRTPTVPKPPEPQAEKRRPLATMISIPVSALLSEWNEGIPTKRMDSPEAVQAMRKVNDTTKMLRACYTETAVQKGCVQVALSLMELVENGYCYNPFLCLQQAAIFASQGPKGGNNDESFKEGLPKERDCSPEEALVIIGRADCLQSLLFADEAVYLCSYVARVCRLHRNRQLSELEWNSKWKVVGICMYNLSVAIRLTRSFQDNDSPKESWDEAVAEEMTRARQDAIAMRASVAASAVGVAAMVAEVESGLQNDSGVDVEMMDATGSLVANGLPFPGGVSSDDNDVDDEAEQREIVAV